MQDSGGYWGPNLWAKAERLIFIDVCGLPIGRPLYTVPDALSIMGGGGGGDRRSPSTL